MLDMLGNYQSFIGIFWYILLHCILYLVCCMLYVVARCLPCDRELPVIYWYILVYSINCILYVGYSRKLPVIYWYFLVYSINCILYLVCCMLYVVAGFLPCDMEPSVRPSKKPKSLLHCTALYYTYCNVPTLHNCILLHYPNPNELYCTAVHFCT